MNKRHLLLSATCSAIALCGGNASATMTANLARGEALITHDVAGRNPEVCVMPKHLETGAYKKGDEKNEKELCEMNVGVNVAACPKENSTNPGVLFYKAPKGITVAQLQAKGCDVKDAKKEAKYKYSTSCSYTPAIVGYYHMSRALGGVANVPVAVLRTMDLERHKAIGREALRSVPKDQIIYKTWAGVMAIFNAGKASAKADLLLTDDYEQSYGALQDNPKKEEFYKEFFNAGPDRAAAFKAKNGIYRALQNPSLGIGREFNARNVQAMVQLKDMADMILLDTIMGQQDRFGNIHYYNRYAYQVIEDGRPEVKFEKDKEEIPAEARASAVLVKQLLLKDNDCGVAKENRVKDAQLLDRVSHLDPKTYRHLLWLANAIDDPETKKLFTRGMMFTEMDFKKVSGNLKEAAQMMNAACRAGRLKLDLSLDRHFSGEPLGDLGCDI